MAHLQAIGITKIYHRRRVVNNVSLSVGAGEVVGLLGPNGAGKTTCFYMIAGLIRPDEGVIVLDHHPVTREPLHRRARLGLGYLPQEPSIFRKLNVADNLRAVLELKSDLGHEQREARIDRLLGEMNLSNLRDESAMALSGGERRRVEIARALAAEPRIMLLDEPFAGVDPIAVADMQEIIRSLAASGIGVLITDHNVRETLGICHRAYILNNGEVIAEGQPDQILENRLVRDVYLGEKFRL